MKHDNIGKTVLPSVIVFSIIVLSLVQLLLSNKLATDGIRLTSLETKTASYRQNATLLEEEISQLSSLTHIASKAAELGFVKENNLLYISKGTRLALHQ